MGRTVIGVNDPQTIKKYSASLAREIHAKSYFGSRMMGTVRGVDDNPSAPIWVYTDLEADAGDTISFDLVKSLSQKYTEGDNTLKGREERLVLYSDKFTIDQMRHGVDAGGKMTRKRTLHDMRAIARDRLSDYFPTVLDEMIFCYLAGARGSATTGWILDTDFSGFAGNALTPPDADHHVFAGSATSNATLTNAMPLTLAEIDKVKVRAQMAFPPLQPIRVDGEEHFVLLIHPYQEHALRTNTATGQWLDIQKAAAARLGSESPIFKGSVGMYNNVVIHTHPKVPTFSNWGSGGNLPGARALLLGRQALAMGFGLRGTGFRWNWHEELEDRGNVLIVDAGTIMGMKKTVFNSKDFGVIALDTYAAVV